MTRLAVVQMTVQEGRPDANVDKAERLLGHAPPADVYLLPELWTSGYSHARWPEIADRSTPAVLEWMAAKAGSRNAWVGGSLITRRSDGALVNRFSLVSPAGATVFYDKGHLFAPLGEDTRLGAGKTRVRAPVEGWTAAMSICFDLRFPEQYRLDAVDGADLFLVVSEWPEPRCALFNCLVRARAIENQAVLAVSNRLGPAEGGLTYCGGSAVIAPDGTVLASAGQEECVAVAEVETSLVRDLRAALPVLPLRAEGLDW